MAILKRWLVLLLSLLALVGCARVPPPLADGSPGRWDTFIRERMAATGIPGAAYAVVDRAGIRHSATFGVDGAGADVTAATPFLWGSVAKPVTARLIASMVETGELRLDAPVVTYLPSLRTRDRARSDRITVRQLLNQTSGLPTSTRHTDRTDPNRRPGDVLAELSGETLAGEPGAVHRYSSTNYLLLAAVVEAVTDRPFAEVLTERVLDPIGMHTTVTTAEQASASLPAGHRYVFGRPISFDVPIDPAGAGYGYLGGTLTDLAAFARASLGDDVGLDGAVPTGTGKSYGLGWRRWTLEGTDVPMVWHGGAAPGYSAQVIVLPEQAIVFTANVYGTFQESALLEIGFGLAERALGLAPSAPSADHTYRAILAALVALLVAGIAAVVRALWLLARPIASSRRRIAANLAVWLLVPGAVLVGFGIVLPMRAGIGLSQLFLWTPDIATLVFAILGLAALLTALRIAVAARRCSAGDIGPNGLGAECPSLTEYRRR
ncbi:serine hydrolase domain-containing protein [Nocardia sp. MW-W600-9]